MKFVDVSILKGKILKDIKIEGTESILFIDKDDIEYKMFHDYDCCENVYNQDDEELCSLCLKTFNQYNNLNFLLKRQTVYQENGRNQSEEEAMQIDKITQDLLESDEINYYTVNNNDLADIIEVIKLHVK